MWTRDTCARLLVKLEHANYTYEYIYMVYTHIMPFPVSTQAWGVRVRVSMNLQGNEWLLKNSVRLYVCVYIYVCASKVIVVFLPRENNKKYCDTQKPGGIITLAS